MPLRGAFIGFGNVAIDGHLPGWRAREDVRITAAADAAPERRAAAAEILPGARIYADPAEMLARERLDFVDICTPPAAHAAAIAAALAADLHVLCEKPTVTRAAELAPLASEAKRRELVLHTVHNWLKAPLCRRITAQIDAGTLGTVRRVEWETLRTQPAITVPAGAATNSTLALTNVTFTQAGAYLAIVANDGGAATSAVAALTVDPAFTKITAGLIAFLLLADAEAGPPTVVPPEPAPSGETAPASPPPATANEPAPAPIAPPLPEVEPLPLTDPLPLVELPPAPEVDGWFVLIELLPLVELDGLVWIAPLVLLELDGLV